MPDADAVVGISDHGGWAVFVTAGTGGALLDRRRVALVDADLPAIPHHVEAQALPLDLATALVLRVRASAERHAERAFAALAADDPGRIAGVALRRCPSLPRTLAERLTDTRARNVADWVMYREALAAAARSRAWTVRWFDAKTVFVEAGRSLGVTDIDRHLRELRRSFGPPWNADHTLAYAAAVVAREPYATLSIGDGSPRARTTAPTSTS